jgi:hypothetical protein
VASCVQDTTSIDLTVASGVLSADLKRSSAIPNPLQVNADGAQVLGGDGWIPLPATLALSSGSSPTWIATTSIDLRGFVSIGTKLKIIQTGTPRYFVVTGITASTVTVFGLPTGVTNFDAVPVTAAYFAPNQPQGYPTGGPFSISLNPSGTPGTAPESTVSFTYDSVYGKWVSDQFTVATIADQTLYTGNSYVGITRTASASINYSAWISRGFSFEARWLGGFAWPVGQTAFGARLMAASGSGGNALSAGIGFAEVTSFVANTQALIDSGWVPVPTGAGLQPTDNFLLLIPQFKSDGTRQVTGGFGFISSANIFHAWARITL